ncbi:hypothetical protein Nepgr_010135 [Nepenthes gracilis]|uniref:Dihydrolipoamide acetyltransferase component of pyruvate dehydrogenase complex n=1 Tax=Nepenthes gracilis TaxID=150966 RepID=A0AAD3XL14_NEPGR|nr:hypothetical protein Nepgr_010135 [Nepenthes gracilis]
MILTRRICRSWHHNFGFRWLYPGASPQPSLSLSPARCELKRPFLGFCSVPAFSRHTLSPFYSIDKRINICCFSSHPAVDHSVSGIVDVPLAQTGEGISECELLKWYVQEGDQVEEFQPLCEVQSDKATIEITSRYKGRISQILHEPGDIVKVGETLLKMAVDELSPTVPCEGMADDQQLVHGTGVSISQSSSVDESRIVGVLCTPAVRSLAKQYGINLDDVQGTGKDGRVLKEDVLKHAAAEGFSKEPPSTLGAESVPQFMATEENSYVWGTENLQYEDKAVTLRGFQRAMVKSMTRAAKIPHFHYVEEIKCDALLELKRSFQNENSDPTVKHTFLPFLVKALSVALRKFPQLNSYFNEEMQEVIMKGAHNIGIAMATQNGLVVPNIKKVQSLSILEITKELSRLQQLAMDNKLSPDDISDGTVTLSNIGAIGGKFGSPLVNLPEVAIIAIGRIQKVPDITDDGDVYPQSIMNVNIGADHRVLDGATVARFCNEWKLLVEKPEMLLLHMR